MTLSFRNALRGSLAVAGLSALALGQNAHAVTVSTIFNTGVLTNNPTTGAPATFSAAGSVDTHYTVATLGTLAGGVPGAPAAPSAFAAAFVVNPGTFPGTVYPNSGTSLTISVAANALGTLGTYYDYRTTFDLTGFSTVGATLQGLSFADNDIVGIFLNGGSPVHGADAPFSTNPFTITTNFNGGINTLDFIVRNDNDTTANMAYTSFNADTLRLNANVLPPVPEPGSVAMLVGMGVTGAGFLARRKRSSK